MSLFLSTLPLWISASILVVIPTFLAMCGPALIRRQVGLERLTTNNEIAGFKFATVGVIYAVLIAFAVIVVWERFSDGESAVLQEAGASATLYRLTSGPAPEVSAARNGLDTYLKLAIERDWPQMAEERESSDVTHALDELYAATIRLADKGQAPSAVVTEMFRQLDIITQARRTRLHLASGIVPDILWYVLFIGAFLTIGFTFFFATENLSAQIMMTGILSVLVLMGLLVIVSIDHPFAGPVHIESDPLQKVLDDFRGRS
jgi:Na+/melibiose symporter-like transporter